MNTQNYDYIKGYQPFWGSWYIEDFLGQGSFGRVFKIYKEEWGYRYESALKIISIPSGDQYREAVATLGSDGKLLKPYFEDAVKNIINEIVLLYNLRGNTNIVSYEDHKVEQHNERIGWDILIRMEYLTPLNKYVEDNQISIDDIINIGIDICSALEVCSKKGIVHRDIKDENIFVTKDRSYKLGDFGIARELSKGLSASIRGTPLYMAPEVYKGQAYDTRADLYSLGILLYKLLNNGRFPFMPPYPMEFKIKDSETAVEKRLSGNSLSLPCNGSEELGKAILKMCEYKPEHRFDSPLAAKEALTQIYHEMPSKKRRESVLPKSRSAGKDSTGNSFAEIPDTVLLSNSALPDQANNKQPVKAAPQPEQKETAGLINSNSFNITGSISGSPSGEDDHINFSKNTRGNIANGGLACIQGVWVYLCYTNDSYNIYKIKTDESEIVKLNSDESWFVSIAGNWIYYSNASDGEKIYRLSIDGTGKERVTDDSSWYLNVFEDWIYYSNGTDNYKLYKVRTDGSQNMKLNNDQSFNISLYKGFIYYSNKSDGGKLYRISIDGKEKYRISHNEINFFCIEDDWIYYSSKSDEMKLFKMDFDGSKKEKLNDDICCNINVYNKWIYYCNKSNGSKIYKIRTDGSRKTKLNDEYSDYINIVGDWIYYLSKSDGNKIHKIRLNGLDKTRVFINDAIDSETDDNWIYI